MSAPCRALDPVWVGYCKHAVAWDEICLEGLQASLQVQERQSKRMRGRHCPGGTVGAGGGGGGS